MKTIKLPLDPLVLSIGIGEEQGPRMAEGQTPVFLGYDRLDRDLIRKIAPERVLSWLFCNDYDAYDVAFLLTTSGFRGKYRAIADSLPEPAAVTREIRGCFPGLDFRVVCPAPLSSGASAYHDRMASPAGVGAVMAPA